MSTTYSVVLELRTTGNLGERMGELGGKMERAHGGAEKLGEAVSSFGERASSVIEGVIDSVVHLGTRMLEVGAGAAFGLATYGVVHLNKELEQTQISLAAIFQSQGFASTWGQAWDQASDQLVKMKKDVQTLPGDLGQLASVMKMIATPAAMGGANEDEIRKLAGKVMLSSSILMGKDADPMIAAREASRMLMGHAGSRTTFGAVIGAELGKEGTKVSAMTPEQRFKAFSGAMDKEIAGSAERFGTSYVATWTTLIDKFKYTLVGPATLPLFNAVKKSIVDINDWFDRNSTKVDYFTHRVGQNLANAWERAADAVKRMEPTLSRVMSYIENLDLTKIEHLAAVGMATTAGAKMLPLALSGGGKMAGMILSSLGEMGAAGAATGSLGLAAGVAGSAALGGAALAAAGEIAALTDATSGSHNEAVASVTQLDTQFRILKDRLDVTVVPAIEAFGVTVTQGLADALYVFNELSIKGNALAIAINVLTNNTRLFGQRIGDMVSDYFYPKLNPTEAPDYEHDVSDILKSAAARAASKTEYDRPSAEAKAGKGAQGHNITINKVEIVVKGNDDPSRTARLTKEQLLSLARNPTSSPAVRSYSR